MTAERIIQGPGTSPTLWRSWLAKLKPPTLALPSPRQRLVIVAPHPDDEVLGCGGLLQSHRAQGGEVLVVAVTDGEASHGTGNAGEMSALGLRRRRESAQGLADLGITQPEQVKRLGLRDGGIAADAVELRHLLGGWFRADDVVITTWRLDGHPDHEATGTATADACADTRCRLLEAPVWMWHWAVPGDSRVPWQRLHAHDLELSWSAGKQKALAAHASQLEDRPPGPQGQGPVLNTHILARATWPAEYFIV